VLPAAAGLGGAAYLNPDLFSSGFRTASFISAALCVVGGIIAGLTIRNPREPAPPAAEPAEARRRSLAHCGLDCPPRVTERAA